DQIALPHNETGLRSTEQFVARKSHDVRGSGRLPSCRLRLPPLKREVDQGAGAEIVGERNARLFSDGGKLRRPDLGGEALNAVIRRVDFQYQSGPFVQRRAIILLMCAIGRTD